MIPGADTLPDDVAALRAALAGEQLTRREAEARASGAEAMVAHLKLLIAKLRHEQFGASSERGRKLLDQLELQLEELEAGAAEDNAALGADPADERASPGRIRRKPVRGPLPAHLPRERVVVPGPSACPCCQGKLSKLGEDVTETLELVPRHWKVVQTVREKLVCRACETITQPPAPFHPIARGARRAGVAGHDPGRQVRPALAAEPAKRGVRPRGHRTRHLHLGRLVGACTATLSPLVALIRDHVLAAERLHGDDTTVPVLAKGKTRTGRLWAYVRDDAPFGGPAPPAALFHYSPDRRGEHPQQHLATYAGILQADAYAGFGELYHPGRKPGPVTEAGCWAHGRRKLFDLAQLSRAPLAAESGAAHRRDLRRPSGPINGLPASQRLAIRRDQVAPLVTELESWMRAARARMSRHIDVARAMDYTAQALGHVQPAPPRRRELPQQQRGRTGAARCSPGAPGLAVLRL